MDIVVILVTVRMRELAKSKQFHRVTLRAKLFLLTAVV